MDNFRLSYRLAIASNAKNTYNSMHGSSIVRKKQVKQVEPTYQQLYDDACTCAFNCNMWNNNFFIYPDSLFSVFGDIPVIDEGDDPELNGRFDRGEDRDFKMSLRSKAKIKDKMYALYRARMKSYSFVTLTFINTVDDKKSQIVLNKFFTQLRKKYKRFHYIWIAERQDGKRNNYEHCTNNIHFHIFFDRFLPISLINKYWVLMQYNEGIEYPGISADLMQKHYDENTMQEILNPVDVKRVRGLNGLTSYMTKYVTKNETTFGCRVWHCSRGISRLFTSAAVDRTVFRRSGCCSLNSRVDKSTGQVFERRCIVTDYAVIYTIVNKRYFSQYLRHMEAINARILDGQKFDPEGFLLDYETALTASLS